MRRASKGNLWSAPRRVKAWSRYLEAIESMIHGQPRYFHEIRHIGPYEGRPNSVVRVQAGQDRAIERELSLIGRRHILDSRGGRPVGLVVGDQHGIRSHNQAVDLTGYSH